MPSGAATAAHDDAHPYLAGNALVCADNLDILKELPDECVDLIYLDPPFQSNHDYVAVFGDKGGVDAQLRDIWRWTTESEARYQRLPHGSLHDGIDAIRLVSGDTSPMAAYALFMGLRLAEMHRVLKRTGSIYLHCDARANWVLRVLMDETFGEAHFRNEITWERTRGRSDGKHWGNTTDTLFFYVKTSAYQWHNVYKERHAADAWTTGDLTAAETRTGASGSSWRGYNPTDQGRHWAVPKDNNLAQWLDENLIPGYMSIVHPHDRLNALDAAGLVMWSGNNRPSLRRPPEASLGAKVNNLWHDIPRARYRERIGYPTQKPLALLERILKASSNPGDLVLDPFCGCGTAADAAAKLGRGYFGIDVSAIAVRVMEQRLASRGGAAMPAVYRMGWEDYVWEEFERHALMHESDAEDGLPGWAWAEDKVAGLLNAVPNAKKTGDGGVDARYYTEADEVIPIQVKMYKRQVGRPELDKLLGVQASWNNQSIPSPMSLMVTLYPPREALRVFAAQQGRVTLRGDEYPRMQVLSVQEMLTKNARPKLPPVDPRYFVGNTQTRLALA